MLGKDGQAGVGDRVVAQGADGGPRLADISPQALSDRIWPYLQAYQDDDMTGEKVFDERVCSARDLALFLARRILNAPYDDLVYRGHKAIDPVDLPTTIPNI